MDYTDFSPLQVYDKLISYNKQLNDFIIQGDYENFSSNIDNFYNSGIIDNQYFKDVLSVYHVTKRHTYFYGVPFDIIMQDLDNQWYFREQPFALPDDSDFIAEMITHHCYYKSKNEYDDDMISSAERKKRIQKIEEYSQLLQDFFKYDASFLHKKLNSRINKDIVESSMNRNTKNQKTNKVSNAVILKKNYYEETLEKLVEIRSNFDFNNNFALLGYDVKYFNKLINQKTCIKDRISIIENHIKNIYKEVYEEGSEMDLRNYFKLDSEYKIKPSAYLTAMGISRERWFNFKKGIWPQDKYFYIALAFYLAIPTSNLVEKFLNKHGYSIRPEVNMISAQIDKNGDLYQFYDKDLWKWIDSGVDYSTIGLLLGTYFNR